MIYLSVPVIPSSVLLENGTIVWICWPVLPVFTLTTGISEIIMSIPVLGSPQLCSGNWEPVNTPPPPTAPGDKGMRKAAVWVLIWCCRTFKPIQSGWRWSFDMDRAELEPGNSRHTRCSSSIKQKWLRVPQCLWAEGLQDRVPPPTVTPLWSLSICHIKDLGYIDTFRAMYAHKDLLISLLHLLSTL